MDYFTRRFVKTLVLLVTVFGPLLYNSFCLAVFDDVSTKAKIGEADSVLRQAFAAVFEAENVGANVSELITKLDLAGASLTEAENADRIGDYSEAVNKANQCSVLANEIIDEASTLEQSVLADAKNRELLPVAFSGIGALVFLTVLVLAWRTFKRSYARKLLNMRPEVES